jgi:putative Mn2+ efflux pump MntP
MYETIASTALIVAREGFESLLLTGMITAALPRHMRPFYYINFAATWICTMLVGWHLVDMLAQYVEEIENILKVIAGLVMIYVFLNSRAIFEHAREHVAEMNASSFLLTNFTIMLIVLREAVESTVFLRSNAAQDMAATLMGLAAGAAAMLALLAASHYASERVVNRIVFRYLGPALVAVGAYYIWSAVPDLLEHFFGFEFG